MKRLCILFALCFPVVTNAFAQASPQHLQVVYITKDYTTEVNPLCSELRDMYSFAEKDSNAAVVFYLANSTSPLIVRMNLPGDNRKDFDKLIDALMTKSETIINPMTDLRRIVGLFEEIPLLTTGGTKSFQDAEIMYYITPTFWELQYNEQIIASVYFSLDMDADWAKDYFTMSIYHAATDGLTVDESKPFGDKNLCANYPFFLLTYSN
jgi:hypothetical protein